MPSLVARLLGGIASPVVRKEKKKEKKRKELVGTRVSVWQRVTAAFVDVTFHKPIKVLLEGFQ